MNETVEKIWVEPATNDGDCLDSNQKSQFRVVAATEFEAWSQAHEWWHFMQAWPSGDATGEQLVKPESVSNARLLPLLHSPLQLDHYAGSNDRSRVYRDWTILTCGRHTHPEKHQTKNRLILETDSVSGFRLASSIERSLRTCSFHQVSDVNWSVLAGVPIEERLRFLDDRLQDDTEEVRKLVLSELENSQAGEWRDALVLFVEHVEYLASEHRDRLASILLKIAHENAFGDRAGNEYVANSAIRNAMSMVDVLDLADVLQFLAAPKNIDTRLVTMTMLVRIREAKPAHDVPQAIKHRVFEIAEFFLQPDALRPGTEGAIASTAVVATASLGDERLNDLLDRMNESKNAWLSSLTLSGLKTLRQSWRSTEGASEELIGKLAGAIERLEL